MAFPPHKKSLPPQTLRIRRKKAAVRSDEAAKQAVAQFWAKKQAPATNTLSNTANPYAQAEAFTLERNAERSLQSYEDS